MKKNWKETEKKVLEESKSGRKCEKIKKTKKESEKSAKKRKKIKNKKRARGGGPADVRASNFAGT